MSNDDERQKAIARMMEQMLADNEDDEDGGPADSSDNDGPEVEFLGGIEIGPDGVTMTGPVLGGMGRRGRNPLAGLLPGITSDRSNSRADGIGRLTILPEAAKERLDAFAKTYAGECPYKVGDYVTVRPDAPIDGTGVPHVVLEIRELPPMEGMFAGRYLGTPFFGARYNMRVATISEKKSHIVCYWVDWADYTPYEFPEAKKPEEKGEKDEKAGE